MKIAKIITECTECEFCVKAFTNKHDKISILICEFPDKDAFMLSYLPDVMSYQHLIPKNCPLENYTSNENPT